MMVRSALIRTQRCTEAQARTRLDHARRFLDVAGLVSDEPGDQEYASVAAALAVLAGIAAADAACCKALGRRSRGYDHMQAADLLEEVVPDGRTAAVALRRLLNLKDEAHYGLADIGGQNVLAALRQARALVTFAAVTVHG
jgi:hypothetical protein